MKLKDLEGKHIFTGIELDTATVEVDWREKKVNIVKIELDGKTYMAEEDPGDGYRSYMETIEEVCAPISRMHKIPPTKIICRHITKYCTDECDILEFVDEQNGEVFLRIGTDHLDDYYPYCLLNYMPERMYINKQKWFDDLLIDFDKLGFINESAAKAWKARLTTEISKRLFEEKNNKHQDEDWLDL